MIDKLLNMGFTTYEARAYITLLENGPLNGYELSKQSGIPKSNAYSCLQTMLEKGFVYKVERESTHFAPRDFKEITTILRDQLEDDIQFLSNNLPTYKTEASNFLTIKGEDNIFDKLKLMIRDAKDKIIIDLWKQDLITLLGELKVAKGKGIRIYAIVMESSNYKQYDSEYKFDYLYNHPSTSSDTIVRDINIVCDNDEALSAQVGTSYCTGIYSQNKNFVNIVREGLAHDILLNEALKGCTDKHIKELSQLEKLLF
ncbi:TrmB family transcriptional regulator [Vallitalea okinawensis]|uniref:TrmB family transcriptional regulator n=1 Tax=Vallitalea okinawensis TaxID=2078660 RepID=UPI000CFDCF58|nr:TrmB family transcriptional regulator [Vallitalea okinawensis]